MHIIHSWGYHQIKYMGSSSISIVFLRYKYNEEEPQ